MRNLKRALSLALASIMVLSMMLVGAGAVSIDDFSDSESVVNKEAVTVLATLGVITGNDDGSYNPTGIITRAEMTTIICRILNGGRDPQLGSTVIDTYTDTSSHWAKAYIEYCTTMGIVSGRGDGTFDPNGTVTVAEAAKMLLVALGYNAGVEGYVGASWQVNTDVQANLLNLYDGLGALNTNADLTRDNAAQMCYNALDADMVQYNYVITGNADNSLTTRPQVNSDNLGTLLEERFNAVKVEGVVVGNEVANLSANSAALNEGYTRISITNHDDQGHYANGSTNFSVSTGMDELGRAVTLYVTKNSNSSNATILGSVIVNEDNVVVSDYTADSLEDVADDNNLDLITSGSGRTQVATNYGNVANLAASAIDDDQVRGVEKILIDNNDDGDVDYVFLNTYRFGKVTSYVSSGDGSITVNCGNAGSLSKNKSSDVVGFEDVARDAYVIAIEVGGKLYVEAADTITGVMEAYREADDVVFEDGSSNDDVVTSLTVDGTNYSVSSVNGYVGGTDTITAARAYGETYLDNEATFYLTKGDYVAAVGESTESAYSYALVLAKGANGLEDRVRVALSDGTNGTYTVSSNSAVTADNAVKGQVYRYSLSSSGQIRLTRAYGGTDSAGTTFTKGRTSIRNAGGTFYASGSTAFFYVGLTAADWTAATSTGYINAGDVNVYTGYNSAPNLESADSANLHSVVYTRTNGGAQAGAVVFYGSDALTSADLSDSLYISSVGSYTTNYVNATAFIAGSAEATDIRVDIGDRNILSRRSVYTYTINSDGYYELTSLTDASDGVDGSFTVRTASSNTFVGSNNVEYGITSNTLLVNNSSNLDSPTGELGAGPYQDDAILWVTYDESNDNEAILVVVRNTGSSSTGTTSDSTTNGDATLVVNGTNLTAENVRISASGNLTFTFGVPAALAVNGDTVSYDYVVTIGGVRALRGNLSGTVAGGEVDGSIASLSYDEGDEVVLTLSNVTKTSVTPGETYTITIPAAATAYDGATFRVGGTVVTPASGTTGRTLTIAQGATVTITGAAGVSGGNSYNIAPGVNVEASGTSLVFTPADNLTLADPTAIIPITSHNGVTATYTVNGNETMLTANETIYVAPGGTITITSVGIDGARVITGNTDVAANGKAVDETITTVSTATDLYAAFTLAYTAADFTSSAAPEANGDSVANSGDYVRVGADVTMNLAAASGSAVIDTAEANAASTEDLSGGFTMGAANVTLEPAWTVALENVRMTVGGTGYEDGTFYVVGAISAVAVVDEALGTTVVARPSGDLRHADDPYSAAAVSTDLDLCVMTKVTTDTDVDALSYEGALGTVDLGTNTSVYVAYGTVVKAAVGDGEAPVVTGAEAAVELHRAEFTVGATDISVTKST